VASVTGGAVGAALTSTTMTELVHLDVEAGRATITLDSPPNRNALSAQLRGELRAHLDTALADDAVRVVVLTHTGPVFCSGMDLRESRGAGRAIRACRSSRRSWRRSGTPRSP
jgi:methylglutaconyl-CoA hydratase